MKRVNEIFYSLQGEGAHTGVPCVFVRFSGCNLRCPFCDTDHSGFTEMTDEEILREVRRYPKAAWVVLTGGEPLLQADRALVEGIHAAGKKIAVETNGTVPLIPGIDWVTVSPKTEWGACVIDRADEIKVVYTGQDLEQYFSLPCHRPNVEMFLQPCHMADEERSARNRRETVSRVLQDPRWRLSLQAHRYLEIP